AQELFERRALIGRDVHQQDILRRSQPCFRLESLNHPAQASLKLVTFDIPDTAIFDEQTQKIVAIGLLLPPEQVALPGKHEWPRRRKLDAGPLLHLEAKPIHPAFLDDILQPRVFSIGAIAKIAMN